MASDFNGGRPHDRPGDRDLDRFANGASARRRRVVGAAETAAHRPDYGDEWADRAFNIPSFPGPAGAPPDSVYKNWK